MYCLFYLEIDEKSDYDLCKQYTDSLCQLGEMTGLKAAIACSEPMTQSLLSAIHAKGGILTIVREDRTIQSVPRFEELVSHARGPTVVQFQLLGSLRQNYDATNQFISRY